MPTPGTFGVPPMDGEDGQRRVASNGARLGHVGAVMLHGLLDVPARAMERELGGLALRLVPD
eukprot:9253803-Lingulodinium_polyedra.AAC.1